MHRELLLEVEAVQAEQLALLRCLIRHHGLRRIFCEDPLPTVCRSTARKSLCCGRWKKRRSANCASSLPASGRCCRGPNRKRNGMGKSRRSRQKSPECSKNTRSGLLEVGAPGRLLIASEIDEVLPLDDLELLDRAKPVTPKGKVRLDPDRLRDRQDAQVKAVLEKGDFGLIVLGGAHDLSGSVRQLGQGRCEYVRVTTQRYREFSE